MKKIQGKRTGKIDFDIYSLPSREKVQEVLKYLSIPENEFIQNPTKFIESYRESINRLRNDEMVALVNMVTIKKNSEFTRDHLKAIYLIAGELVGRFLGYAIRSYYLCGLIPQEKIKDIYNYVNSSELERG